MPVKSYQRKAHYRYKENVKALLEDRMGGSKKSGELQRLADFVGVAPTVVRTWFFDKSRDSLPNVEQGYDIASYLGANVQRLVTGEDPANYYSSPVIREIVELLEPHSNAPELLIEIRGLVKRHLSDYAVSEAQKREMA